MVSAKDIANRGPITVTLMLTTIIYSLDTTIANVALPHIQGTLSASQDQITWVLTSYIVASAIVTPLGGWLNTRLGRKRLYMLSVAGFTIASMLCGLATNLAEMVVFRMAQGALGAFLVPMSQAILLDINPVEKHGRAMAVWSSGALLGPICGPVVGGWLTEHLSWRWAFFINLPVGLLALAGLWVFLSRDEPQEPRRFDFLGFFSLAVAVGALQLMLDRGPGAGWLDSFEVWAEIAIMVAAFWVFVTHTLTTHHPFFDPSIMRDRNFVACNVLSLIVAMSLWSSLALMPMLMQNLLGYPVFYSGFVTAARGIGAIVTMAVIGPLMDRFDVRAILVAGFLVGAASVGVSSLFDLSMTATPIVIAGLLQGVATGLLYIPMTALAFVTIAPALRPEGSSIFSLLRNIGSSVGISLMQGVLVYNTQVMHSSLAAHVNPTDPVVSADLAGRFDLSTFPGLEALNSEITRQAAMVAYVGDFRMMFYGMLLCIPAVFLLRPAKKKNGAAPHVAIE